MPKSGSKFKRSYILKPSQKVEVVSRLLTHKQNINVVLEFIKTEYNQTVSGKYIRGLISHFKKSTCLKREPFSDTGGGVYYDLRNVDASMCLKLVSWI